MGSQFFLIEFEDVSKRIIDRLFWLLICNSFTTHGSSLICEDYKVPGRIGKIKSNFSVQIQIYNSNLFFAKTLRLL